MSKIEDNKKKKKEALFNTAYELFTSKGIQGTSISDIVNQAGVAKGTFYLYFTDKYDIRDKLIIHKATELIRDAHAAMVREKIKGLDNQLLFICDFILEYLVKHKKLLRFISKNLIYGIYSAAIHHPEAIQDEEGISIKDTLHRMIAEDTYTYEKPDVMIFTIIELIGSASYHSILYSEPLPIEEYKEYLYNAVRSIMATHRREPS